MNKKPESWINVEALKTGETEASIIDKIIYCRLFQHYATPEDDIIDGSYCYICGEVCENEPYFFVETQTKIFVIPKLILHYIRKHKLKLPEEVEKALQELKLPFPRESFRKHSKNHIPEKDVNFVPKEGPTKERQIAAYNVRALKYAYDFGELSEEEYESQKDDLTKAFHSIINKQHRTNGST